MKTAPLSIFVVVLGASAWAWPQQAPPQTLRALFEYTLALATLDRAVGVAGPKGDETR